LQTIGHSPRWEQLKKLCGSEPKILGTCKEGAHRPILQFLNSLTLMYVQSHISQVDSQFDRDNSDCMLVYYYRHRPSTLRFYTLDILRLDAADRPDVTKGSDYLPSSEHDFTAPRKPQGQSGLNGIVINQACANESQKNIALIYHTLHLSSTRPYCWMICCSMSRLSLEEYQLKPHLSFSSGS
jgi:hypothetical protein